MSKKHQEWELAGLLEALGETAPHESWLAGLTGWPEELVRAVLRELARKKLIRLENGWIRREPWPESLAAAVREALPRMEPDDAEQGMFAFFRFKALDRPLDALEALIELGRNLAEKGRRLELRLLYHIYMDEMLKIRLRALSDTEAERYFALCHDAFQLSLCVSVECGRLITVLFRGRGLARLHGNRVQAHLHALLIGAANCLEHSRHNTMRFHAMMEHALTVLQQSEEYLLQGYPLPVGIYFFMQGKFRRAIDTLLPESVNISGWPETHSRTHRYILASLAAFFLGESDEAIETLRQALRNLPHPGYPGMTRILRAMLAMIRLGRHEDEAALELLDVAIGGTHSQWDLRGWQHLMHALAQYHAAQGRIRTAALILGKGSSAALREGYRRPVYLFPATLELLDSIQAAGLPAVPGYDLEEELNICSTGPNLLLRGVALRIRGNRLLASGRPDDARFLYEQSLDLLRAMHAYDEVAKTRLALAAYHLSRNERQSATSYAIVASLRSNITRFPPEIAALLPPRPSGKPVRENHVTTELELLGLYLDPLRDRTWTTPDAFRRHLVALSCRVLDMPSGRLFVYDKAQSTPVSVARHGPPLPPSDLAMTLSLVDIALSGTPILITLPPAPGQNQDRSIICIPLPCGQENCVLHHDGVLPAWAAALLTEPLLARIGQSLGREMLIAENALPVERELHPAIVPGGMPGTEHIVFQCRVMREFMRRADLAAASDASVLLTGESGVGKELVARRIHALSGRSGNFVPVNLAGIPDDLFENEFLGHERGAFTGAWHQKRGLLELADNGTLFLDELAETSLRVQVKLLRLLQERSFLRLGGTRVIRSNFRLVAATNRNLEQAVRRGAFREDLYYRIRVIALDIPPLRERREDIPLLVRHYLHLFRSAYGRSPLDLPPEEMDRLAAYDWPGNIRELRNRMEQFAVLQDLGSVLPETPPSSVAAAFPTEPEAASSSASDAAAPAASDWQALLDRIGELPSPPTLPQVQDRYMKTILSKCAGRIDGPEGAAELLGVSRSSLYAKRRNLLESPPELPGKTF
ncbi:MAG: hypothetical protein DBY37_01480 [Desulfovibrionaceae bacterium]|nr:MAG: hypothetical protein DBY37_01480 [Desulfovibrionaceae bacterium]